jgi:glycerol uptake facilitator-like aquaporin
MRIAREEGTKCGLKRIIRNSDRPFGPAIAGAVLPRMKTFRESWRTFLVYMSFAAFLAAAVAITYFLFKLLPQ